MNYTSTDTVSSFFEDGILEVTDFIDCELPIKEKILDPWLTFYSIVLICGARGIGKTWFSMYLVDSITKGIPFGPWSLEQTVPCLYLEGDMPGQDTQARFKALNPNHERKAPLYIYSDAYAHSIGLPRAKILDEEWRAQIKRYLL